ncbi:P-loop NTPase fold protein [Providencia rettgeri]|uniref:KAP family P-loop NTPase fold protein n=1 Tax=Providencia rettgeri TaxID=587 RepID=UPI0032DACD42
MQSELSFSTRDEFSRKPIAEKLINLLESDIDLSPIVINGDWGTGKTEFCLKTIQEMKGSNEKLKCVYIDAFNADSSDEPILTLIAAIVSLFPDKEDKKSIINKAIPVIKYASKVLLNASTTLILKENAEKLGEDLSEALKDQTATAIDATIDNLLDTHEKSTENISALRSILESLSFDSPVIVFIDELDRCRPNYALKMIESIKHIFNIKNVKFVLVTNVNQLSSSINKLYGESINANRYMDKFIGFKIDLPDYSIQRGLSKDYNSTSYFRFLIREKKELSVFLNEGYFEFAAYLIEINNLSLRDVEKFVKYLLVYQVVNDQAINDRSNYLISLCYIIGIFIYSVDSVAKEKFLNKSYSCEDLIEFFSIDKNSDKSDSGYSGYYAIERIVINFLKEAEDYDEYKKANSELITKLEKLWEYAGNNSLRLNRNFGEYTTNAIYRLMLI